MRVHVNNFLRQLERDIRQTADAEMQAEQLLRLQEVAAAYNGEDKLVSSLEIAERMQTRPPQQFFKTGFSGLDKILGGFLPKQLIVISAATKSGKTSFCIDITSHLKAYNPVWLPFEESAEELIQKFLDRKESPPLFYTPERMIGNTLMWVEKKIIEAKAKYDSKVCFIDHLHFIVPFSAERQDLAIGQTMRELKRMAKQWNVVVVLIAHLKKTKMDTQADLEDLRDSSFIAQEADTLLMLWRQTKRENGRVVITNNVNVSVQANRRTGRTGNVQMVFNNGRFEEMDFTHEDVTQDEKW
jgi:replicative DNA helicase